VNRNKTEKKRKYNKVRKGLSEDEMKQKVEELARSIHTDKLPDGCELDKHGNIVMTDKEFARVQGLLHSEV